MTDDTGRRPERIYLVGLSGSGKSTAGAILASRLGWRFTDCDRLLEERAGRSIPAIMDEDGEEAFRDLEAAVIRDLSHEPEVVVSTGGGALLREANQALLLADPRALTVWLAAPVETLLARLREGPGSEERPLLRGDALARLRAMQAEREPLYRCAALHVDTEGAAPEQVAEAILAYLSLPPPRPQPAARVRTATAGYDVLVGRGRLAELGQRLRDVAPARRCFVIADQAVAKLHGPAIASSLAAAGLDAEIVEEPLHEETKNLETASRIFDRLVAARAERKEPVVAFGGGVATDLGGFVAATYLRGVPLVHVPTTLLGMVDAAIGGKVAVDHPQGKNLVGAFYQPSLVLCDTALLGTLPPRQLRSGFAEVIKHAVALDTALIPKLERDAAALLALEPGVTERVVSRSVATKAAIVAADEKEGGLRSVLNYGHTLGHALEAVTSYSGPLHGEAVSAGMMAAARISAAMGLLDEESVDRQEALLAAFGLPTRFPEVDVDRLLEATLSDKKVAGGKVRWVLLEGFGRPVLRDDVPASVVRDAVLT